MRDRWSVAARPGPCGPVISRSTLPQVTEAGRLRCWFAPFGNGLGCSVREVREEVPGQVMSMRSRSTQPTGRQAFTLSVQPHDRGSMVVMVTVPREDKRC
jgi:hypothetical protein